MVKKHIFLLILLTLLPACGGNEPEQTAVDSVKNQQQEYRIGTYFSPDRKRSSNSYWIEGPGGLVLIDTQLLISDTQELLRVAESITGKKVQMAIILQPSAQKFNGAATLVSRGIRVVSSSQVVDFIPQVDKQSREKYLTNFSTDYPPELKLPEALWDKTQEFEAAGLRFKAYIVRDAVSEAHLLIGLDGNLFVGDLIMQGEHVNLESVDLKRWKERLEEIKKFVDPEIIYPGKGYAMAGDDLLAQQESYLDSIRKSIAEYYTGGKISEADIRDIVEKIQHQYPHYKNAHLLEQSVIDAWESKRQSDHEMFTNY